MSITVILLKHYYTCANRGGLLTRQYNVFDKQRWHVKAISQWAHKYDLVFGTFSVLDSRQTKSPTGRSTLRRRRRLWRDGPQNKCNIIIYYHDIIARLIFSVNKHTCVGYLPTYFIYTSTNGPPARGPPRVLQYYYSGGTPFARITSLTTFLNLW